MGHIKILSRLVIFALLIAASEFAHGVPLGTAFTYQGQLTSGGAPANGTYDLALALFDDPTFGSQVGSTVTNLNVAVTNGLFTTAIDFGPGMFNGSAFWLAIGVRSNGSGAGFTPLTPRQPLNPAPYALYATVAPLADGSVTSAKILDGTIATADLANNSVTTAKIADGTIANADLANDAVTSAKILDGTILGADVANNTIGSAQLADIIALGDSSTVGRLDVFFANTLSNQPAITLFGNASQISTYGSDSKEQIRLWGTSYGEILLYDSSTTNHVAVTLTANATAGGSLILRQGNSFSTGANVLGDSLGGGRLLLDNSNAVATVDIRSQFDSDTSAAWATFKDGSSERVSIAARNGTSGRGGLIDVKNDGATNTLRLIGDAGASRGTIEMYNGGTIAGRFEGHAGGSWLRTYDETGALAATIGTSASTGGFCELNNSSGAVGLRLDGDDAGGGLIQVRNAAGVVTVTIDGDLSGDGRVTTQELQITGGSDLSEQFDITSVDGSPKPGMVVCIDPKNPGQLIPNTRAYDRTVAGIISGAGGIKPGMLMGQKGTAADGKHPVALTGRVYAMADTCNGPIEPGDLITTSATPGHAMKATDSKLSQGAILGKAMTRLADGKGLVLVLVSLQ